MTVAKIITMLAMASLWSMYETVPIHGRPFSETEQGAYHFAYDTRGQPGAQLFRQESRGKDGLVRGSYGYIDPNGYLRKVDYSAGPQGFQAWGDTGVDKRTSEQAQELSKLAPLPSPIPHGINLGLLYPRPAIEPIYHSHAFRTPYLGIGRPIFLIRN